MGFLLFFYYSRSKPSEWKIQELQVGLVDSDTLYQRSIVKRAAIIPRQFNQCAAPVRPIKLNGDAASRLISRESDLWRMTTVRRPYMRTRVHESSSRTFTSTLTLALNYRKSSQLPYLKIYTHVQIVFPYKNLWCRLLCLL